METHTQPLSANSDAHLDDAQTTDDDVFLAVLAAVERHKENPDYVKRLFDDAAAVRRRIDADYLREMDGQTKK